jgi:hypothetical protein
LALVYLDGVGYVDDGGDSGGGGSYDQSQQSPYAYNQTYNNQSVQSPYAYNEQQDQQPSNLYVPDQTPSFDYNPETPFNPNDYQSYSQPQQDFSSWFTPQQPQQDYSDYYSQEATAQYPSNLSVPDQFPSFDYNPETPFTPPSNLSVPDDFKSDGSVSSMYEQESYMPTYRYGYNGSPLYPPDRAYYAQQPDNTGGGNSWGGPDYGTSGSFGQYSDWNGTSNAGTPSQFYEEESRPLEPWQQISQGAQKFAQEHPGTGSPLGTLGDLGQGIITGLGAAVSPLGAGVKLAADSNIPVVSDVAGGVRNAWEQVVEPAGGFFTSTAGSLSKDGNMLDFLHGSSPIGSVIGGAVDVLQGRDPTQYYKDAIARGPTAQLAYMATNPGAVDQANAYRQQLIEQFYRNQLAQGKTPEDARREAGLYGVKIANPFTVAEMPGQEGFSKLPAPAQLGLMFLDPVGNPVYNTIFKPLTHGIPSAIKGAADKTGVSAGIDKILDNTVRAPDQRAYKFGQVADEINLALKSSLEAVDGALPEPDVMRLFLKTPDSPLYYATMLPDLAKEPRKQAVIAKLEQMYDASPVADLSKPDAAATGGKFGTGQSEFGQRLQDTSGAVDPNAGIAKPPTEFKPTEAGTVDPKQAALDAQSQADFNAIKSAAPAVEPTKLPDTYKPIKLPDKQTGGIDEFFGAAKTAQAVDVKALRLDNTLKNPGYRPALKLEEWGPLGKAIRVADKPVQVLSRVYLETLSRAIRDPLSNYTKLAVVDPGAVAGAVFHRLGIGDAQNVADRFKTIFGDVEPLGHASMSADIGGGRTGKESGWGNLAYHIANPFNELTADVLRGVSKGKFQSYTKFIEDNETLVKQLLYKREALRIYDDTVKSGPKTEFFKKNPEIYKAIQSGKMSLDDLDKVIQGRVFNGFDLNDLKNGKYNPAIPSTTLADTDLKGVLDGTAGPFGQELKKGIGSLSDRVKAENARKVIAYLKVGGLSGRQGWRPE